MADKLLSSLELELKCLSAHRHEAVPESTVMRPYGIDGKTVSPRIGRTV